jgi:ZIP family zinc transporter
MVIVAGKLSNKTLSVFLGLAVGIMVGVVILDLIPSAWKYGNFIIAVSGFFIGLVLLAFIDKFLCSIKPKIIKNSNEDQHINMGYLIAIGIALHDLPEGIAIAAGFEAAQSLGVIIAIAIGLHNIPEGMATAAPLSMGGMSRGRILLVTGLVSLFTPVGTLIGMMLTRISPGWFAILLALAGGAMIYVVIFELIPEVLRGQKTYAWSGSIIGFGIIVVLSLMH